MELKSKVILWKTFDISYNVNAKLLCTWFLSNVEPTHYSIAFLKTYPFLCLIYPLIIELMICNLYAGRIFQGDVLYPMIFHFNRMLICIMMIQVMTVSIKLELTFYVMFLSIILLNYSKILRPNFKAYYSNMTSYILKWRKFQSYLFFSVPPYIYVYIKKDSNIYLQFVCSMISYINGVLGFHAKLCFIMKYTMWSWFSRNRRAE